MFLHGTKLQWNGRGECGLLPILFFTNHLAELSGHVIRGPMGPTMSSHRDTLPHAHSSAWQGGLYVRPL